MLKTGKIASAGKQRHCNEAIEKYERSQGLVPTKASKQKEAKLENIEDSKPSTSSASKQVSSNGKNGKKNGRKKGKKRASSVGLVVKKPETKKQKLEEFPGTRARSTSFTKRKGSNSSNGGKTTASTNSFSKDTTPLRSDSLEGQNGAGVVTRKHAKENNENGGVLTKKHSKLNVANISLITSVHPSGIEGIMDLVADVVMKDGSIKSVLTETLKNEAPKILFDYYERAMELKD
ncbi:unnamed protein product [Meloidogyne enterolobii]|uniref:Uncharacterized protein n=1 Tax=Meloidogyne enterolobii TaxID=390850 RepID=A0ACB1AC92_MELEN